jgi:programmed cell death protein 5
MEDKKDEVENEELKIRIILKSLLEQEAYDRMSNIKISSPELYNKVVSIIVSLAQRGQVKKKVSDDQLKLLISQILSQRKERGIVRISK